MANADKTSTRREHDQAGSKPENPNTENWTPADWENYLSTLDVGLKESQLSSANFIERQNSETVFDLFAGSAESAQAASVEIALAGLTERQRLVINATFWEGKSERKIAALLGISRPAVHRLKRRAIKKLRTLGVEPGSVFPLVRSHNESDEEGGGHG